MSELREIRERVVKIETTVTNLDSWMRERHLEQSKKIDKQDDEIKDLQDLASRAKGGWWVLGVCTTVGGAIGGVITKFFK